MMRYLSRLSGPLIDRIDLHVEVPAIPFAKLKQRPSGESSEVIRVGVLEARKVQAARQGGVLNSALRGKMLEKIALLDDSSTVLMGQAVSELGLSARAYDKVRRVARTIADLEGKDGIEAAHVAEAIQYRVLDRMV
jgi:magnesium chelatase family protein